MAPNAILFIANCLLIWALCCSLSSSGALALVNEVLLATRKLQLKTSSANPVSVADGSETKWVVVGHAGEEGTTGGGGWPQGYAQHPQGEPKYETSFAPKPSHGPLDGEKKQSADEPPKPPQLRQPPSFGNVAGLSTLGTLGPKYFTIGDTDGLDYAPVEESKENPFASFGQERVTRSSRDKETNEYGKRPQEEANSPQREADHTQDHQATDSKRTQPRSTQVVGDHQREADLPEETADIEFSVCIDAQIRGYSPPFACCSMRNGDFFDKSVWSCGRIPTMLDAVFVRHFVRLSSPEAELRIRSLWVIESLDPVFAGHRGVLRGGQFPHAICRDPHISSHTIAHKQLDSFRRNFRLLLGEGAESMSLSEICAAFTDYPFDGDNEFKNSKALFVRVEDIGGPIPHDLAWRVAMTSVSTPAPEEEETADPSDFASLANFSGHTVERKNWEKRSILEVEDPQLVSSRSSSKQYPPPPSFADEPYRSSSPILPFPKPQPSGNSAYGSITVRTQPEALEAIAAAYPQGPAPGLHVRLHDTWSGRNLQRARLSSPLKATGAATVRVEKKAALLFFENISLNVEGDLRNDGTFFIGETILEECVVSNPDRPGLCRIPSLISTGSLVAMQPINVLWLQIAKGKKRPALRDYWYGIVQYNEDLPNSHNSAVTFFGPVEVKQIIPGFSLSFKRVGFPPNPPPPARSRPAFVRVLNTADSSDLLIYVDLFDDDGFIDCCEQFHETDVAEFEVMGVSLKIGRYSNFYLDVGDPNTRISEQIVIRAPRITAEQMFIDLPAVVAPKDAILTNVEVPAKLAGVNRDIVYFQCLNECNISNQTFKREKPYRVVEVKRELKKDRSSVTFS